MRVDHVTVLVVEDEILIRVDIADHLRDQGFEVIEAGDADEAIRLLEARSDIHLVFTDIDMPGSMDGLKLAAYIRGRWPPIKLIVTSGHVTVEEHTIPSGGRFFTKPYEHQHIASAIAELVAARPAKVSSIRGCEPHLARLEMPRIRECECRSPRRRLRPVASA